MLPFFVYISYTLKAYYMKRYNVHLKDSQLEKLEAIAKEREEPVSRLIRDAVDAYIKKHR